MRKIVFGLVLIGLFFVGANAFAADGDLTVNGRIDANSGIKIGNVTTACSASLNGVLRYTGTAFEFCNGTAWVALGSGSGGSGGDTYTKLLLHMDGTNGSTAFTDSSASAHSLTANGNAQISTSQSKFGGASGYFNGSSSYLGIPDSDDWNFGSGDFTIDGWFNYTSLGSGNTYYLGQFQTSGIYWIAQWYGGQLGWGSNGANINCGAWSPSTNTWYHLAWVITNGTQLSCYVNGTRIGNTVTIPQVANLAASLTVGAVIVDTGNPVHLFNGYIDELRISKGIARWTANFTPPTTAY